RALYEELWPGELVSCPWGEEDDETTNTQASQGSGPPPPPLATTRPGEQKSRVTPLQREHARECTISGMDFGPARKWLSDCHENSDHGDCKPEQLQWQELPGVQMRVIDVDRLCVTEVHG